MMDPTPKAPLPDSTSILLEAMSGPDDHLGRTLLAIFIREQAADVGLSPDGIDEPFGEMVVNHVLCLESKSARNAAVEKALHKAALGQFDEAGRLLREWLIDGAATKKMVALAQQFVPIGMEKIGQAKEFGRRGAEQNKAEGETNRRAVISAAKSVIGERITSRRPTARELAPTISEITGLSESTVRRHLTKSRLDKLLD